MTDWLLSYSGILDNTLKAWTLRDILFTTRNKDWTVTLFQIYIPIYGSFFILLVVTPCVLTSSSGTWYVLSLERKKRSTVYEMSALPQAVGPQLWFLGQPLKDDFIFTLT